MRVISVNIGPRFAEELAAAGIGDGISWSSTRVSLMDGAPEGTLLALRAVVRAHDRTAPASPNAEEVERSGAIADLTLEIDRTTLNPTEARRAMRRARALLGE